MFTNFTQYIKVYFNKNDNTFAISPKYVISFTGLGNWGYAMIDIGVTSMNAKKICITKINMVAT